MNWPPEKRHKYFIESDAGYKISKAFLHGIPDYTAWAPLKDPCGYEMLGSPVTTAEAEKQLCEARANMNGETASGGSGASFAVSTNKPLERDSGDNP